MFFTQFTTPLTGIAIMKKMLAAGAVGIVCAGSVQAQSNVVIYGVLDTYAGYTNAEGTGNVATVDSGGYQASRIGLRGAEDLGGGVKATYTLEGGIASDTGAMHDSSRLFNRQAWVGLSSGYGELRFGRQNSSSFLMIARLDTFAGATYGSFLNNTSAYTPRYDNVIGYISPVMKGFKLQAYYSLGERSDDSDGLRTMILAGEYERGPLYLGVSSSRQNTANGEASITSTFAGGSYDYGQGRLYAGVYRGNNLGAVAATNIAGAYYTSYSISGNYRLSDRATIGAGYGWGESGTSVARDARQISLIGMLDLSRRTLLYTTYAHMMNKDAANYTFSAAAPITRNVPTAGGTVDGLQFGIRHLF